MCGIVGCVLKNKKAAPILLECVKKLEYRGYDSIGIATVDTKLNLKKDKGKIKNVEKKLDFKNMPGKTGIAHVRWATHGNPNKKNAHPQTDENEKIAVVHNGIIRNYREIKEKLEKEGHIFKSQTDTEIIPHLIEKFMNSGLNLENSLKETLKHIKGSYALCAISKDNPKEIIAARKDSPLIVGLSQDGYFLASDSPAFLKYTNKVLYPDENEIVIINEKGVTIKDNKGSIKDKKIETINWAPEMAEKEGYDYFMLKEINEEDIAFKNTLTEKENIKNIISKLNNINRICFVACGTSYHASLVGKYLIESMTKIPTDVILASEFKYSSNTLNKETLAIFISQSGETADTLKALKLAKKTSKTIAIVNVVGSRATREADYVIYTRAGPEIGVAATKTYISQLTCIYIFAAILANNKNLLNDLKKIPDIMKTIINKEHIIEKIAKKYKDKNDFFFIGRGYAYPIALEGSLKLKEITYIHAEGYAAGELKHGPLALIDKKIPVVVIVPKGKSYDKTMSSLEEVKTRGADVIAISNSKDKNLKEKADHLFYINENINEIISPLIYAIPLQLLAYHISIERGLDPDHPRNLAKSVTVE